MKKPYKNKLLSALQFFSVYELNRFRKFITSPYFNEQEVLVQLFDLYKNYLKKSQTKTLSKEKVWQTLCGTQTYNDIKFRRYHSDLLQLAEDFLTQQHYEKSRFYRINFLFQAVNEQKISVLYQTALEQVRRWQTDSVHRDNRHFLEQFELESHINTMMEHTVARSGEHNIAAVMKYLDAFYLGSKLKLYCTLLNFKNVIKTDYEPLFLSHIISHLQQNEYTDAPMITAYYQVLQMLQEPAHEEYYRRLKTQMGHYATMLPAEEIRELYVFLQNYCIRQCNSGNTSFLSELFELYQIVLRERFIFSNDKLSASSYKNIVTLALRLNELDWVEHFIENYQDDLYEAERRNAYTFNRARLYYARQQYEAVIQMLAEVEYEDVYYMLDTKILLLKTYYDLDEDEALYSLIESFKVLLQRKKILSDFNRGVYLNFLKYLKKLREADPRNKKNLSALQQEIEKSKNIADVTWLLKKLNVLIS